MTPQEITQIQLFYNKIIAFIERLLNDNFSTYNMDLINHIESIARSSEKNYFGMIVSLGQTLSDRHSIEFLNGQYILQIMMDINSVAKRILKNGQEINLSNRFEIFNLYNDLKEQIKLLTGISLNLDENLEEEHKKLLSFQSLFEEGITLFINLYKSPSSGTFATRFRDSNELRDLFGISVRNPNRENITDENFYFLRGKYYVIPNSAYIRIQEEGSIRNYVEYLNPNKSNEEKVNKLQSVFQEILEDIQRNKGITSLSLDFINLREKFPFDN